MKCNQIFIGIKSVSAFAFCLWGKKSFFIVVLQSTVGDSHFLCHFSNCHNPLRNCSVFCHNYLPPGTYYKSLRGVTNKTFLKKFEAAKIFLCRLSVIMRR